MFSVGRMTKFYCSILCIWLCTEQNARFQAALPPLLLLPVGSRKSQSHRFLRIPGTHQSHVCSFGPHRTCPSSSFQSSPLSSLGSLAFENHATMHIHAATSKYIKSIPNVICASVREFKQKAGMKQETKRAQFVGIK